MRHGKSSVTPTSLLLPSVFVTPKFYREKFIHDFEKESKGKKVTLHFFSYSSITEKINFYCLSAMSPFIKDKFFLVCYSLGTGKLSTKKLRYFSQHSMKDVHHCD